MEKFVTSSDVVFDVQECNLLLGLRTRWIMWVNRQYESQKSPLDTNNMSQDSHIVHFQFASDLCSVEKTVVSYVLVHFTAILTVIHISFSLFLIEYF